MEKAPKNGFPLCYMISLAFRMFGVVWVYIFKNGKERKEINYSCPALYCECIVS